MPSFDIVSEVDKQEVRNAVEQVNKEVGTRFDFKGSDAKVEQADFELTIYADDEFKLGQVVEIIRAKFTKRKIDTRSMELGEVEKVSGNKAKQSLTIKTGVETVLAKNIIKLLKSNKLKVQASIQGDLLRVTGGKRDVLQEAIQLIKKEIKEVPLQYQNFRE